MLWEVLALIPALAFAVGHWMGSYSAHRYWRSKANPDYRTAVCSHGQFFYVMPEKEYVSRHLAVGQYQMEVKP